MYDHDLDKPLNLTQAVTETLNALGYTPGNDPVTQLRRVAGYLSALSLAAHETCRKNFTVKNGNAALDADERAFMALLPLAHAQADDMARQALAKRIDPDGTA